ncbi:uncharacterized protein [Ptychodera flava]|uniref:uncharacterized protein n=1 Tax=Ptychodera flava TaxID=63121 RepID=UPI00396A2320
MDAAVEINRRTWKREASVLIISDRWGHSFQGGIPTALRILASFFRSFRMSTYCTVLQKTHEEEKEAKIFDVKLICPEPRGSLQRTKPDSTWLLSHEAHFQNLKTRARDIDVVLGFGLTTSEAAMFIKDLEFRNAKYYIANLWPLDEILEIPGIIGCDRHELEKRIDMFSEELSKAKILISMDQNTFEYCFQMHSIPTCTLVQIMAQPSKRYYDLKPPKLPENDNPTFRILSFLEEHDVDELRSHRVIANAMNLVAEDFKSMNKTPPKWKILGVPEGKDRLIRKKLKPHSHLNVIPMCLPTVKQIEQELQSSHLVLIPESPGMNSLNLLLSVMAVGIPLITKRYSPCHNLIKKLVANKVNIEHMLTSMNPDDTQELRQKIVHMLCNFPCRVQSALKVKACLMESAGQLSESCNRAFEEEIKTDIRTGHICFAIQQSAEFVISK